jgi:capsular exopolysaccharide synthesis family protein
MPGDGKTCTAISLASIYSLMGKRTVLIGFDLRKPKIIQDFSLDNKKGVTTWLIGQDKVNDIIQESGYENLSIITAGPVPPNPAELITLPKTADLLSYLKSKFDIIILDTSPLGVVSDTNHLASLSDTCLLVVRPGKTLKSFLEPTISEVSSSTFKGISLVINDIKIDNKKYGYGEKYGYIKDNTKRARFSLSKR